MFKLFQNKSNPLVLNGQRIYLRPPVAKDYKQWRDLRVMSANFLQDWEPKWSAQEFDPTTFKYRIKAYKEQIRLDKAYPFFIFKKQDDALIGGINIADVKRRSSQYANLGYWMGEPYQTQGFMSEAVEQIIEFSFENLCLNRLHAACMPHNAASIKVLLKNNFTQEGFRKSFLNINGEWQDHLLFGRIKS